MRLTALDHEGTLIVRVTPSNTSTRFLVVSSLVKWERGRVAGFIGRKLRNLANKADDSFFYKKLKPENL